MKKLLIGVALAFWGLFADIGILLFGAIYGPSLSQWQTSLGPMWTAIVENHLRGPFVLATGVMVLGIVVLVKEYFTDHS